MKQAIDISNFDVPFTAATVTAFKDAGVEAVIVGCQRTAIAREQIAVCRDAGMPVVGVYAFLYWGNAVISEVGKAIDIAKNFGVSRVWLDCEDSADASPSATPGSRLGELANAVASIRNAALEAGIYTGKHFWQGAMGNTTQFAHLSLWHASYWNDRHYQDAVDYGGWTRVAIHQYASSPALAGRNRDYNVIFEEEEEMGMTPEEKARFERVLKWTVGSDARMDEMETLGLLGMEARLSRDESNDGPIGQRIQALEDQQAAETRFAGNELADGDIVRLSRVKDGQS